MRKTPVVLGVLSIIFGALVATFSLLGFALAPLFGKMTDFANKLPNQTELQRAQLEAAQAVLDSQIGYMRVSAAVFLVMSTALVAIGVGLYRRRAWARRATVTWAALALLLVVFNTVAAIGWLQPHQRDIQHAVYAAHGVTPPFELPAGAQSGIMLFSALLYAAYPIVLLALIGRRSATNDFLPAS